MNVYQEKKVNKIYMQYTGKSPKQNAYDKLIATDKHVKTPVRVFAYVFGVIGSLVLGTGMCLAMKIIFDMMILGIAVGCVGIVMVAVNYPIYKGILGVRKKMYSMEIEKLTKEIFNED